MFSGNVDNNCCMSITGIIEARVSLLFPFIVTTGRGKGRQLDKVLGSGSRSKVIYWGSGEEGESKTGEEDPNGECGRVLHE